MLGSTQFACDRSKMASTSLSNGEVTPLHHIFDYPLQLLKSMRGLRQPTTSSVHGHDREIELTPIDRNLTFCELPVPVRWLIFSYLDSKSLCAASVVSTAWFHLAGDELLWRRLLKFDMPKWQTTSHLSHPTLFKEAASDFSTKEIYMRCHPDRQQQSSVRSAFSWQLRFHLPRWFRRPLRLAMFGPGLDSMDLVRKMIFEPDAPFKPNGMFPGSDGVGSGICIQHGTQKVNLITLFSATKQERRQQAQGAVNRLVNAAQDNEDDLQVSFHVQELCKTIDAFICVVDSSSPSKEGVQRVVHAMVGPRSQCQASAPVLIYAAAPTAAEQRVSCVELADVLQLTKLSRPWQVQSLALDDLGTLAKGFDWLIPQCQI